MRALAYLEIPFHEVQNNEADNYIASIINNVKQKDIEFIIVSTDTDFFQLINKRTFLYIPRGKNSILYDTKTFKDKFNIMPSEYIFYKSLIGDKTDNISGIKGIGKITAIKIINSLKEEKSLDIKIKSILEAHKEKITRNICLITLNTQINTKNITFSKLNPKILNEKTYEILNNSKKGNINI